MYNNIALAFVVVNCKNKKFQNEMTYIIRCKVMFKQFFLDLFLIKNILQKEYQRRHLQ